MKSVLGLLLTLAATNTAGEPIVPDHADVSPGHSFHGEVFNEGPRQKAYLMGKTGNVRFPITVKSAEARKFFEQGVGQLHGFWYFEAERSFRHVSMLDPDCAMAYWGMAMANHENEKRAAGFIKKARELLRNTDRREQLYIECLADYLLTTGDKRKRQQGYLDALKKIHADYPTDIEAQAFYVVRAWQFKLGLPTPTLDRILDDVLKANPLHPAHHYRIHLWDNVNPSNALASAALCGEAAPTIAHMWHMPGHTYDKLKRFPEAVWQQEASSRADHAHMMKDGVLPDLIHNYVHNQEWLIRNLSQIGRANDAVALSLNLIELPRHPKYNTLAKKKSASYGRTRLLEMLERYELWDTALKLADTVYLEPTEIPEEQIKRLRLLGLAHAGRGERAKLQSTIALLEKQSIKAVKPAVEPKGKVGKGVPSIDVGVLRDNTVKELRAYDTLLGGELKAAMEAFKSLKNVNPSRLARYYLQAGDQVKAEQLAKQAADAGKMQVVPLAVYVEILHAIGKTKECSEAFDRLRKMSGSIDSLDSPVFARLAPIAKELKLPDDWRQPLVYPKDFGKRPSLDSIGPLVWRPTPAPLWDLPDVNGKPVSLKAYAGKATIVIFYLGYGCPHCMEQVQKFAEQQKAFADAGISIVAVSTDGRDALTRALSSKVAIPFPVASDPKHEVFKQYRTYDDFERQPLHGTFLIDGRGLIRWHDIGHEPFMTTDFLLKEARRLLALPSA